MHMFVCLFDDLILATQFNLAMKFGQNTSDVESWIITIFKESKSWLLTVLRVPVQFVSCCLILSSYSLTLHSYHKVQWKNNEQNVKKC